MSMLAILTAGGNGFGTFVICLSTDGHAEFESMLNSCCLPHETSSPKPGSALTFGTHDCGDCIDIMLTTPLLTSRFGHADVPIQSVFRPSGRASESRFNSRRTPIPTPADGHSPTLALLSSVILLT